MRSIAILSLCLLVLGCSIRRMALNSVANSFGSGDSFQSEADVELAGEALPFGLKLMESLAKDVKDNPGLYTSLSQGFLLYAYGYIEPQADRLKDTDFDEYERQRKRAKAIYQRAHNYAIAGLAAASKGFAANYPQQQEKALAAVKIGQVGLLYAAGASLAKWCTIEKLDPAAIGRLSQAVAFIERAWALDSCYDHGALYEFMAFYEGRPAAMGGDSARAMSYYQQALALAQGKKISAYMTYVETFAIPNQDKKAFRENLEKILSFDLESSPEYRLTNSLVQNKARLLLQREGELFVEEDS